MPTVHTPTAKTGKAMAELEKGEGKRFVSPAELLKDLGIPAPSSRPEPAAAAHSP